MAKMIPMVVNESEYVEILRQAVAVLPWFYNLILMQKLEDNDTAIFYYAQEAVRKGWNRDLPLNACK